jgi:hypothetical protein
MQFSPASLYFLPLVQTLLLSGIANKTYENVDF